MTNSSNIIISGGGTGGHLFPAIAIKEQLVKSNPKFNIHFVGSSKARQRVLKMGEIKKSIYNIGSPDLDVILKKKLPIIESVKKRYSINFKKYCILIWHPVTSNISSLEK